MAAGHAPELALRRHLAAHAVMFALRGIPATYVQSVVAGDNDRERFARTGEARRCTGGASTTSRPSPRP